jgi:uncharacterized protein YodC (DUF2158 family)
MADKFNPGDIVQLKSGGPKMTVTQLIEDGSWAYTAWFAGSKHETGRFPVVTLIPISDPSK